MFELFMGAMKHHPYEILLKFLYLTNDGKFLFLRLNILCWFCHDLTKKFAKIYEKAFDCV